MEVALPVIVIDTFRLVSLLLSVFSSPSPKIREGQKKLNKPKTKFKRTV